MGENGLTSHASKAMLRASMDSYALCEWHDLPAVHTINLNGAPHGLCHRCVRLYKHLTKKLTK